MFNLKSQLIFLLLGISLAACSSSNNTPQSEAPETESPSTSETSSNSAIADWKTILGSTSTPPGWSAAPCDDRMLLCVRSSDKQIGSVELSTRPLDNLPDFQQMLVKEGIPNTTTDTRDPKHADQVLSALKVWILDHYNIIAHDRKHDSPTPITLSTQEPEEVQFGSHLGLRYEFATTDKGSLHERSVGYLAVFDNTLYVVQTTVEPGSKLVKDLGTFTSEEDFQSFEPHLEKIVANLKIPNS